MSKNLTVTYAGLNADELRVVINDKRAVGLRPGCAITELRALDRTARELQDTCRKQAQRIAALEMSARQALEAAPPPTAVVQEPVLVVEREPSYTNRGHFYIGDKPHIDPTKVWKLPIGTELYTAPQPTRQPLTDGELDLILQKSPIKANYEDLTALVRAVEKAHGIGREA